MTAKNLALATITGTARTAPPGRTPSRSFGDRIKDVYNVKDFGAKGDFSTDDTAAIQAAFNAAGTAFTGGDGVGGTIFFPPGGYNLSSGIGIDISTAGGTGSRIIGSGPGATFISGTIPNGFVFHDNGGSPSPGEIANISISNTSQNIGTGALTIANGSAHIHNCSFGGMMCVYLPFNIYDMVIERCTGGSHCVGTLAGGGTGHIGTLGIAGYAPHIKGWRSTGTFQTCFQLWGVNGCDMTGNGIENCEVGMFLGATTGWASHCTVNGDKLTCATMANAGEPMIGAGCQIFMTGLPMKPWGTDPSDFTSGTCLVANTASVSNSATTISGATMTLNAPVVGGYGFRVGATVTGVGVVPGTTIAAVPGGGNLSAGAYTITPGGHPAVGPIVVTSLEELTGAGFLGTYRLSSGGHSITTPVPMWARASRGLSPVTISCFQNEACHYGMYLGSVGAAHIAGAGGNSTVGECVSQYGVTTGWNPHSNFYMGSVGQTVFSGCSASNNCYAGSWYFVSNQSQNNVTFISCGGKKQTDNAVTASISGTVLTVTAISAGGGLAINMPVTGSGVTAGTIITGSRANEPDIPVTLTIANPAVFTKTAHGLAANDQITFEAFTGLPPGLTAVTTYYVITAGMTADTFKLSASAGPGAAVSTVGGTTSNPDQRIGHSYAKVDGSNGLTGYNSIGTYRVNNSQSSSPTSIPYGPDWVLPTATYALTGLQFINCGANLVGTDTTRLTTAMPFASLPGQVGTSSGNVVLYEGWEANITDGTLQTVGTGTACSITTSVLTVGGTIGGQGFNVGDILSGTGVTSGTRILSYASATTYNITPSHVTPTGTITITASNIPMGTAVTGGGNQHIKVRYNGTNWTRCG